MLGKRTSEQDGPAAKKPKVEEEEKGVSLAEELSDMARKASELQKTVLSRLEELDTPALYFLVRDCESIQNMLTHEKKEEYLSSMSLFMDLKENKFLENPVLCKWAYEKTKVCYSHYVCCEGENNTDYTIEIGPICCKQSFHGWDEGFKSYDLEILGFATGGDKESFWKENIKEINEAVKAFHKVHCDENSLPLKTLMKFCTHLLEDEDWAYGDINVARWEQYDYDSVTSLEVLQLYGNDMRESKMLLSSESICDKKGNVFVIDSVVEAEKRVTTRAFNPTLTEDQGRQYCYLTKNHLVLQILLTLN